MRRFLSALVLLTIGAFAFAPGADAQEPVVGVVEADPGWVEEAGEYTFDAVGSGFIPETNLLVVACTSPGDELVPGEADIDAVTAAAGEIDALADCTIGAALPVTTDADGGWTAELTAEVGPNFFLSAGALDGSQLGATWIPIGQASGFETAAPDAASSDDGDDADTDDDADADAAAEEEDDEPEDLAETGVETALIGVAGATMLAAGALVIRETRRF